MGILRQKLDLSYIDKEKLLNTDPTTRIPLAEPVFRLLQSWTSSKKSQNLCIMNAPEHKGLHIGKHAVNCSPWSPTTVIYIGGLKKPSPFRAHEKPGTIKNLLMIIYLLLYQLVDLLPAASRVGADEDLKRWKSLSYDRDCAPEALSLLKEARAWVSQDLVFVLCNLGLSTEKVSQDFYPYIQRFLNIITCRETDRDTQGLSSRVRRTLVVDYQDTKFLSDAFDKE